MRRALAVLTAAALLLAAVAGLWTWRALAPADPDGASRVFVVERGESMGSVARRLEQQSLVRDARALRWWARLRGQADRIKAGEYALSPSVWAPRLLDPLVEGRVVTHEVVLPEGVRAREIAARLEGAGLADADAFLAVVHDRAQVRRLGVEGDSLEGYLFPETYRFPRGLPPEAIAEAMVGEFLEVWRGVAPRAHEQGLSMHDVVTLASIVEKETAVPSERPLIAAVFLNRLERGMRLETDPTVIYGVADFDGNLRKRHLLDASNPYNTYRHAGLPPGPIANPGAEALHAVVAPAETDYLYFVSTNDGTHKFSSTYREHRKAVDRYQRKRSASR